VILESDDALRELLLGVRTIGVLGIKAQPSEDAYRVPAYLQREGYRIRPVNPKLLEVLGEAAVPALAMLREPVELVNVFRAPHFIAGHAAEIISLAQRPRAVWLQLGIRDDAAAAMLSAAGIDVVQDRCILVEHRRLIGARADGAFR
jgi:predicted CoA-binding protein